MMSVRACGSSPRTRGTDSEHADFVALGRFIPAHAGNRRRLDARCERCAVHPRARGEQRGTGQVGPASIGSSPRTRGTVWPLAVDSLLERFIPAHAGNSSRFPLRQKIRPVHPRARGEQLVERRVNARHPGSSPRTRGTERDDSRDKGGERFIPAHAGNSQCAAAFEGRHPVHPRARGEQRSRAEFEMAADGSSPRTRGTGP